MERNERIIRLCKAAGADRYLTGPAAKEYLDEATFAANGIGVGWMDYAGYAEYRQLWGGFEPNVSIVDLLFNTGSCAAALIGRTEPAPPAATGDAAEGRAPTLGRRGRHSASRPSGGGSGG